jgi:hypothetical protein
MERNKETHIGIEREGQIIKKIHIGAKRDREK